MRCLASIAVVVGVCALSSVVQAGGPSLAGSWAGEMRQIDVEDETRYPMTLTITRAKVESSYPTLRCAGVWTRIGETKDGYTIYHEKIVNEPGATCIDGVFVARAEAGKLIIGWFGVSGGAPGLASAVLSPAAK